MSPGTPFNPYRMWVGSFMPNWLSEQRISPGAKLTYGRLGQYAGRNGERHPGQKELAFLWASENDPFANTSLS
jgi:hypothetical protein